MLPFMCSFLNSHPYKRNNTERCKHLSQFEARNLTGLTTGSPGPGMLSISVTKKELCKYLQCLFTFFIQAI